MTYIIFFIITTILHFVLLNKSKKIANYINLNDKPDNIRKFQIKYTAYWWCNYLFNIDFKFIFFLRISDIYFNKTNLYFFTSNNNYRFNR